MLTKITPLPKPRLVTRLFSREDSRRVLESPETLLASTMETPRFSTRPVWVHHRFAFGEQRCLTGSSRRHPPRAPSPFPTRTAERFFQSDAVSKRCIGTR